MKQEQMRQEKIEGQLINRDEAAAYLHLSPETLRAWGHMRRGPRFVKCGRAVRYRLADLQQWVEDNLVETG